MISADRIARFEAKCIPEPNSGCKLWFGGCNEHGYGVFWNGERLEKAHRFALRASGVSVADDQDVRHRCDTPACVEPSHLAAGSTQENVDDMWARSRATVQRRRGTAQTQAKLSDEAAVAIRAGYVPGVTKQRDIADLYGVSQRAIWNVLNGRNWTKPSGLEVVRGVGR
jgi:hypothetical protein